MFPELDFSPFTAFFCKSQSEKKQKPVTSLDSSEFRSFIYEEMDRYQSGETETPEFFIGGPSVGKITNQMKGSRKAFSLYKQLSLSNDTYRDKALLKGKDNNKRRSKSVINENLDELRGFTELGFGFDSKDQKLSDTLPSLDLYYAINKKCNNCNSKSTSFNSSTWSNESPHKIFGPGDNPQLVKMRLRHWA